MFTIRFFLRLAVCFHVLLSLPWTVISQGTTEWPIHSDGLTTVVEWDHYSYIVNGERIFLYSGEFHPWRLPVPEMWTDILQKIKASGLNGVSFYFHWGWHAPTANSLDFTTGAHNIAPLYQGVDHVGIYVTSRPGPYINAETNAGGFPLWVTTGAYGSLRNNDSRYTAAWTPYMTEIAKTIDPFQVTQNGTALLFQIENEYGDQWTNVAAKTPDREAIDYMELLEANARANGIDTVLTHNNPNEYTSSWSKDYDTVNAGGDVDVSGVDSYPACWSCILSQCGTPIFYQVQQYYDYFMEVSPTQPFYFPEFQGGAYNPVGGPANGCFNNSNQDFVNLFYRNNIAEKSTAMSLYMMYGGTNWGWFAFPDAWTSYDYSAPISEDRSLNAKYYELKLLALFTRVAMDLRKCDRVGNSTSYTTSSSIFTSELRNPDTGAEFYVIRHNPSTSNAPVEFKINVLTSAGNLTIPQKLPSMALSGYQSKILTSNFNFSGNYLLYSTAEVLTYAIFDNKPTIALWVPTGESGEFSVEGAQWGAVLSCEGCFDVGFYPEASGLITTFGQNEGMSVLELNNGVRVLLLDRSAAYSFWAPPLNDAPQPSVEETVFVVGPYLVRSAEIDGSTLAVTGDVNETTTIEAFAPYTVSCVTWNGKEVQTFRTAYGSLKGSLPGPQKFAAPTVGSWKTANSLPEPFLNYSDTGPAWVVANHMTTVSSQKNATLPYLYVDEYGFHVGNILWRGYFNSTATGVYLSLQGGTAFGFSAYLNGAFLGSFLGDANLEVTNLTLSFANATLNTAGPNVLLVIQDDTGHDETNGAINVRGILNATLLGASSSFYEWKVAGTAGGSTNTTLDPVRGVYNEGGLYGERLGWHLPGFDDSSWASGSPQAGFTGATVQFYRSSLPLNVPAGLDVSLSFVLSAPGPQTFRALLYVNGYQYARFAPYVDNQYAFPVPPGILDYNGDNTIALAVWSQTEGGAQVGVDVQVNYVTESSLNVLFDGSYLRPGWDSVRLQYS